MAGQSQLGVSKFPRHVQPRNVAPGTADLRTCVADVASVACDHWGMALTSTERSRAHRARKAASIEAPDRPVLRDASELMVPFVDSTIAALDLPAADLAQAQLARNLAAAIDSARDRAWALRWLSPHLQEALKALKATPAARPELKPITPPAPAGLSLLREQMARDKSDQQDEEMQHAGIASRLLATGMDTSAIAAVMAVDELIVNYWLDMAERAAEQAV
jgi:hypothetical protein